MIEKSVDSLVRHDYQQQLQKDEPGSTNINTNTTQNNLTGNINTSISSTVSSSSSSNGSSGQVLFSPHLTTRPTDLRLLNKSDIYNLQTDAFKVVFRTKFIF